MLKLNDVPSWTVGVALVVVGITLRSVLPPITFGLFITIGLLIAILNTR